MSWRVSHTARLPCRAFPKVTQKGIDMTQAKGFGSSKRGDLGYVLLVLPKFKGYAADFTMRKSDGEFIGITSCLELAQVWKKKSEVREVVGRYFEYLIEEIDNTSKVKVRIKKLKRLSNGKLKDEPEEDLLIDLFEYCSTVE